MDSGLGVALLAEDPSRARKPDRDNVGPCFCVELCNHTRPRDQVGVSEWSLLPLIVPNVFTGFQPDQNPGIKDHRAFFANLRLNGILSKTLNGNPMEYRFEVHATDASGALSGSAGWTPVSPSQIAPTAIGEVEFYDPVGVPGPFGSLDHWPTKDYVVNGVAGPEVVVPAIVAGWIRVPQASNSFGPEGFFAPNGNMISLMSDTLASFPVVSKAGLLAGSSGGPVPADAHFKIRMRVREVGNPASEADGGTCQHVAINNTYYKDLMHHPVWMPVAEPGLGESPPLGIALLDIAQLVATGCSDITNALDVVFTATQPHVGAVSISMTGPGGPYGFTLPAATTPGQDWFGTATPNFVVSTLQSCAYIVKLSVPLLLTTGDGIPNDLGDESLIVGGSIVPSSAAAREGKTTK